MRVVNASPLIVLSKLGRLDLLLEPRPDIEVVVPQAVLDEVMRGEPDDPAVSLVPKAVADWMRVIESNPPTPFRGPAAGFQPARLGAGGTPLAGSLLWGFSPLSGLGGANKRVMIMVNDAGNRADPW